jgi:DNA-binding CsgD family transcriptional regulator
VELLERDGALGALAAARDEAALGTGRVVFVTGEAGIGKTSLVTRFVRDLEADARVLFGTCDDLSIPRPLGPLRDLIGTVSRSLEQALAAGAASHELQSLLIAELELPPRPTVLVVEDVHWADDATLDSITVLGRRIGSLPAVVVLTFRSGEAAHPLRAAIGAIRAEDSIYVELAPLSESAVASLAGDGARGVYAATGGNPFYVTELLASPPATDVPPSITNAVLGRVSRLDEPARRLMELVSVVPSRAATAVLDEVMPEWTDAAEEPERQGLLEVEPKYVRFRHELARNAIRSSLPAAARRRLHAEILRALLALEADPADIVHHAEAAGADDVVAGYALVAARRAAELESNREAYSHYRRAADFVDGLPAAERADVLEELAKVTYAVGRLEEAFPAMERAIEAHALLGHREAVGRCTRLVSRFYWYAGDGFEARRKASEAVEILEPLGESVELAHAYSGVSQLAMLADETEDALEWGERALELAIRLRDDTVRVHALVNIGSARMQLDERESEGLLEAIAVADLLEERHEATRALSNLAYSMMVWIQPEPARRYAEEGLAYAREHEVHTLAPYLATIAAWLQLRACEWEDAERTVRGQLAREATVPQLLAKTVLAHLAIRRGDDDAADRLADVAEHADRTGEAQRAVPVVELATEWALTGDAPMPVDRIRDVLGRVSPQGRHAGHVGAWAAVAGVDVELAPARCPAPYEAMRHRDWRAAADAFGEVGWSYDRALMLSLLDDEESLVEALELARSLGSEPLTRRAGVRLRELGLAVPHGPREATRANPAGLTTRQLEVLALLADGLTNAEIADRLVVSPRTAEHHVAAVLTKLGAPTRRDVARRATELGLLSGTGVTQP